jgi:predicted nuclease with RNAse H fold
MMTGSYNILKKRILGIDYGNKYSGTTVICYNSYHQVRFLESSKNSDADAFILNEADHLKPDLTMIDAPLSLPGIYYTVNGYTDRFFRICDRKLNAMSPMFLGGLTARAMSVKGEFGRRKFRIIETYPRKLVEMMNLPLALYKKSNKDLPVFTELLKFSLGLNINTAQITSWHRLDALLAFLSGIRYLNKEAKRYGKKEEGLVYV